MHTQFDLFKARIDATIRDIGDAKAVTQTIGTAVSVATVAVKKTQDIGAKVDKADSSFDYLGYALTAL